MGRGARKSERDQQRAREPPLHDVPPFGRRQSGLNGQEIQIVYAIRGVLSSSFGVRGWQGLRNVVRSIEVGSLPTDSSSGIGLSARPPHPPSPTACSPLLVCDNPFGS